MFVSFLLRWVGCIFADDDSTREKQSEQLDQLLFNELI